MNNFKRITILCGHYGSGKTGIAVQLALDLKKCYNEIALADIDIVNPYFRSTDSAEELEKAGVRLITSAFAGTNLDVPALPQGVNAITDDKSIRAVIDVGGDDRGATALGRWADKITAENDYEMLAVLNMYRPLTKTAADAVEVMDEISKVCKIPFTAVINNSNLGAATTEKDILNSVAFAEETAKSRGLAIKMTTVNETLYKNLQGKIENLYPLTLRRRITIG